MEMQQRKNVKRRCNREKMSNGDATEKCQTEMQQRNVKRRCNREMSNGDATEKCQTEMQQRNVKRRLRLCMARHFCSGEFRQNATVIECMFGTTSTVTATKKKKLVLKIKAN
ncbi:hypothetical protein KSP39_PZI010996 [Platanthera zijinensis]|uniref:Uncharacterized protein n=1 Tax=Platanthera zijinensis TaxID=2320716 RepID=A0AAP0BI33_9ASPA